MKKLLVARSAFLATLFVFSILSIGCQRKDYYTAIQSEPKCQSQKRDMSPECRAAILAHAPIDVDSFVEHPMLLEEVIYGVYLLMNTPVEFPKEKKIARSASLEELEMNDFIERIGSAPNPNQALVNYVLNATPTIRYGCTLGASERSYYAPDGIRICSRILNEFDMMLTLLHEARHSETGPHEIFCPDDPPLISECDIGFDGPNGWQFGLTWGMLQGIDLASNQETPFLLRNDIRSVASNMKFYRKRIYGAPKITKNTILESAKAFRESLYIDWLPYYEKINGIKTYPILDIEPWQIPNPSEENILLNLMIDDWDGDGSKELLRIGQSTQVHKVLFQFYKVPSKFALELKSTYERKGEYAWAVQAIDFNHDRYPDLVYVFNEGFIMYLGILQNRGNGNFDLVAKYGDFSFDYHDPKSIKIADMDQDGNQDIVVEGFDLKTHKKSIQVLFREGAGFKRVPIYTPSEDTPALAFEVGDVTRDGIPDVLFGKEDHQVTVLEGTKSRSFHHERELSLEKRRMGVYHIEQLHLLDLDRDGVFELFVEGTASNNPSLRDSTLFRSQVNPISENLSFQNIDFPNYSTEKIFFVDLNKDPFLDAISFSSLSKLQYGISPAGFSFPFYFPFSPEKLGPNLSETKVLSSDLNQDGFEDLIAFQPGHNAFVLWNPGANSSLVVW